jgi:hypothetical protein
MAMKSAEINRDRGKLPNCGRAGILTPEEYGALMDGLADLSAEVEYLPRVLAAEEHLTRLTMALMIQAGLLMAVLVIWRSLQAG